MASSKVMSSSASRNSDLRRRSSSSASSKQPLPISEPHHHHINHHPQASTDGRSKASVPMTVDGLPRNDNRDNQVAVPEGMLLDAEITLLDAAGAVTAISDNEVNRGLEGTPEIRRQESGVPATSARKSLDDVWREMVDGRIQRKECKQEAKDEMMTLEDFLVKAGAVEDNVKVEPLALSTDRGSGGIFSYDSMPLSRYSSQHSVDSMMGFGSGGEGIGGRGKKRAVLEPLDKAAQQRQRRMIKNRESAARSRERKQAYQAELESLAVKLEEENAKLLTEKEKRTKERLKQIMENVIPIVEGRKPKRPLRRVRSMHW